jgi:hypothetical protein
VSALDAQIGYAKESTYGTPVTVNRFSEFNKEEVTATYGRIESDGLRVGRRHRSDTRFATYVEGAAGDLEFEVGTKGFGFWLDLMLGGSIVTTGPTADGAYTHSAAGGSLNGKAFTLQVGRPFYDGSSVQPFTYQGGKIGSWELSNDNSGLLICSLSCDFQSESTATALAAASYPTGVESMAWVGATVTIGGTQVDVTDLTIGHDNKLRTGRRYLRGNGLKKEPVREDFSETTFELSADFDSLAHRNRVAAATAAGTIATIVARWEGVSVIGGTTKPSLVATLNARFDAFEANVDGPAPLEQSLTGVALGASAVNLAYTSSDATP